MREIDEVRITLLRLFRGAVRLPEEIIDEMLKAFLHTQDAAIKVQAESHLLYEADINEWPGIQAIWATRASRLSRRALELDRGRFGRRIWDEPLALFGRWMRYTEKRMAWYNAHHRLRWTRESSPAYWRMVRAYLGTEGD